MRKVKDIFKIIVIGAPGVGKTTLIEKLSDKIVQKDIAPKIGVNFFLKQLNIDEHDYKFQFWDFFDEEKFGSLHNFYYKGASAIFYVFDLSKPETFDSHQKFLKKAWNDVNSKNCPVLVIGNKLDLVKNPETLERKKFHEFVKNEGLLGYIEVNSIDNVDALIKGLPQIIFTNLRKNHQVKFLVNSKENEEIKRYAKLSKQKKSDFIRTAIWEKISSMNNPSMTKSTKDMEENQLHIEELKKIRKLLERLEH
jgi:small GTP-binding protein